MANFDVLKHTTMYELELKGITDIEGAVDLTLKNAYDQALNFAGLKIANGDFNPDQRCHVEILLDCIFSDKDAVEKDLDNSIHEWKEFKTENESKTVD